MGQFTSMRQGKFRPTFGQYNWQSNENSDSAEHFFKILKKHIFEVYFLVNFAFL